ncbi:Down syndrome cell adhesion molecule-like protein 1 [Limulus polyphemus]|uniref:Down syndrome cell adhesion molecule-like protein 1 n=1 Tax=Limulus polyphemus TaxID=6850 RepID=A0ABM1SR94_LIMPO|nr:Down syndrome cell adhesion molecule-like protein 1 [Limulus polyphemus]
MERISESGKCLVIALMIILKTSFVIETAVTPRIQPFNFPKTVTFDTQVSVTCAVSEGSLPVIFSWKRNGQTLIAYDEKIHFRTHEDLSTLKIQDLDVSDIGNYTCIAKNSGGVDSYTSQLLVKAPPYWKSQPVNVNAILGKQAFLHCDVGGYPRPHIAWKKFNDFRTEDVVLQSDYRTKILDNGSLAINSVEKADEGLYTCDAENGIGEGITASIRLELHVPPNIIVLEASKSIRKGESALLQCAVSGERPLTISWIKNGNSIDKSFPRYDKFEEEVADGLQANLVINDSEREDEGRFVCKVENNYGEAQGTIQLQINEPPSSPLDVRFVNIGSRSARVVWRAPPSVNPPIVLYIIRYWKKSGALQEISVSNTETTTLLNDLHAGFEYIVQILAKNDVGVGQPSEMATFTTKEEEPDMSPTDLLVEPVDSHSLQISWKPPPPENHNGLLKGYHIGYKKKGTTSSFMYETIPTTNNKLQHMVLKNLQPSTSYTVIVKAFNSAGTGPPSDEFVCLTLLGDPPPPPELKLQDVQWNSATVTWSHPRDMKGPVFQYLLEYGISANRQQKLHIPGSVQEYTIQDLNSGQHYTIHIAAYNKFGCGKFSSPLLVVIERKKGSDLRTSATPDAMSFYFELYFVIPVAASVTVVICVVVIAWACLKRTRFVQVKKSSLYVAYKQRASCASVSGVSASRNSRVYDVAWEIPSGTVPQNGPHYTKLKPPYVLS